MKFPEIPAVALWLGSIDTTEQHEAMNRLLGHCEIMVEQVLAILFETGDS